ncbi:hypothetical protein pdam_00020995 [Pocillopora damicornis]|uniref:SUEL-type lectin domain-containing protein n=1 Tax=Pocillopora damicornis TaxID=46731 RepID=A0A3M6TX02_POCDA|nr:hypothetical protein pdam_00020995 [Pocillopora damicornis]
MVNSALTQMPTTFSTGHLLICEGESGQLRCNKEGKINVLSANYGRLESHSCPHWMTTDTNCHSGNSLSQVQQICQSNSTCELKATNIASYSKIHNKKERPVREEEHKTWRTKASQEEMGGGDGKSINVL